MTNADKLKKIRLALLQIYNDDSLDVDDAAYNAIDQVIELIDEPHKAKKVEQWSEQDIEYQLSVLLFRKIKERRPQWKRPNLQRWSQHVDYLMRRDGKSADNVRQVIEWCQQDTFWQSNVLSTDKLRTQFDRLDDLMRKDVTWMSRQKLKDRQVKTKQGPTMRDQLRSLHG